MKALIDGDILRYEIGFAAETGWKAITGGEDPPPFSYVDKLLDERLNWIMAQTQADDYQIYFTEGRTFRDAIAVTKPYKGNRVEHKPWHFKNLTAYLRGVLNAQVVTGIEADDAISVDHVASGGTTIICSRDKDLRQVPGFFYGWELGRQPSFGPVRIDPAGSLTLSDDRKKLSGTGFAFFCAQVLMGDQTDNIPGLPGWGPVKTHDWLATAENYEAGILEAYEDAYGTEYEKHLLEQGRLCWMTRRLNPNGTPELWQIGMTE